MKPCFLYVVLCTKDGTLYTGISVDVERRVKSHNGVLRGGAKYTRSRRPVRLLAMKMFPSRSVAMKAERWFKTLSHAEKLKEIERW